MCRRRERTNTLVDLLIGLIQSALMIAFVCLVIAMIAGLFMVVFRFATGIDRRIQD